MTATMALALSVSLFTNFCLAARSEIEEPDKSRDNLRRNVAECNNGGDRPTGFELYV